MVAWPETLPHKSLLRNWETTPIPAPMVTDMESGDIRQRPRPSDDMPTITWARTFFGSHIATWQDFLKNDIAKGYARFEMPVIIDGINEVTAEVQIDVRTLKWSKPEGRGLHVEFTLNVIRIIG